MPRKAREKYPEAIFHIMCRSESEFLLFRDNEDKDYYLGLLKKYIEKYKCSIYAYCLMDTHLHLHLDPRGFDVSKFMHCTNTAYVVYYNRKYKRHGHVFQDRFVSRIIDTDEYNLAVSAYIHNNPQNIEGFSGKEQEYEYSSYGIYLGIRQDVLKLIDKSFIMGLIGTGDLEKFAISYFSFVSHQRDIGTIKQINKKVVLSKEYEYVSGRKVILRDISPSKVVSYISDKLIANKKNSKEGCSKVKSSELRALTAYALRAFCGLGYKDICSNLYNITISGCARLCNRGFELLNRKDSMYFGLFSELIG